MTPDLTYLVWTAVLCVLLWIPYIAAGAARYGFLTPSEYQVPGARELPAWANRAQRAHLNLVENLPSFAALVIVAELTDAASALTATGAALFFWSRLVQTVVHITGTRYIRTAAFFVGWLGLLMIAWGILVG